MKTGAKIILTEKPENAKLITGAKIKGMIWNDAGN